MRRAIRAIGYIVLTVGQFFLGGVLALLGVDDRSLVAAILGEDLAARVLDFAAPYLTADGARWAVLIMGLCLIALGVLTALIYAGVVKWRTRTTRQPRGQLFMQVNEDFNDKREKGWLIEWSPNEALEIDIYDFVSHGSHHKQRPPRGFEPYVYLRNLGPGPVRQVSLFWRIGISEKQILKEIGKSGIFAAVCHAVTSNRISISHDGGGWNAPYANSGRSVIPILAEGETTTLSFPAPISMTLKLHALARSKSLKKRTPPPPKSDVHDVMKFLTSQRETTPILFITLSYLGRGGKEYTQEFALWGQMMAANMIADPGKPPIIDGACAQIGYVAVTEVSPSKR